MSAIVRGLGPPCSDDAPGNGVARSRSSRTIRRPILSDISLLTRIGRKFREGKARTFDSSELIRTRRDDDAHRARSHSMCALPRRQEHQASASSGPQSGIGVALEQLPGWALFQTGSVFMGAIVWDDDLRTARFKRGKCNLRDEIGVQVNDDEWGYAGFEEDGNIYWRYAGESLQGKGQYCMRVLEYFPCPAATVDGAGAGQRS